MDVTLDWIDWKDWNDKLNEINKGEKTRYAEVCILYGFSQRPYGKGIA